VSAGSFLFDLKLLCKQLKTSVSYIDGCIVIPLMMRIAGTASPLSITQRKVGIDIPANMTKPG
jgi:hypothetical protein